VMKFEWDVEKAASNLRKHGVSFDEAGSVFLDRLALSGPDPEHSQHESRYITFGCPAWDGCLRFRTHIGLAKSALSMRAKLRALKGSSMKKAKEEMRAEYQRSDFTKLERGKFYKEVAKGTAVVLLDPVVAKAFPTSEAVNEALLGLLTLTEQTARITGRSKRTARKRAVV
jgi:uncharacterized DUF497 family protein